jgi:DNA-nicking Smr family endonuclease
MRQLAWLSAAMSRKPNGLTDADRAHWAGFTAGIRPLGKQTASSSSTTPSADRAEHLARAAEAVRRPIVAPSPLTIGEAPAGVDRASWNRFRSGKLAASRTLDLHGLTAQQAFHAVAGFLRAAQADRLRCVEIVTGRGSRGEGGVIRREFREWLNRPDLRSLVLAAVHPHPANPGAVNVLLRRPKPLSQSGRSRGAERRR